MRPEDLVSAQEACRLLGITRLTLLSWIEQGKVKTWGKLGGHAAWFFLRMEVNRVRMRAKKYERAPSVRPAAYRMIKKRRVPSPASE